MKKVLLILIPIILFGGIITFLLINNKDKTNYLITITATQFKEKINNKESFILYVGSYKCSMCKKYTPTFKSVLTKYKIKAYYIDMGKFSSEEYSIFSDVLFVNATPTVVFINKGDEKTTLSRLVGAVDSQRIISKFKTNGYIK